MDVHTNVYKDILDFYPTKDIPSSEEDFWRLIAEFAVERHLMVLTSRGKPIAALINLIYLFYLDTSVRHEPEPSDHPAIQVSTAYLGDEYKIFANGDFRAIEALGGKDAEGYNGKPAMITFDKKFKAAIISMADLVKLLEKVKPMNRTKSERIAVDPSTFRTEPVRVSRSAEIIDLSKRRGVSLGKPDKI